MPRQPREFRVRDYLQHIAEAAARIQSYTAGLTEEAFLQSPLIQDAVVRNFEIIGEACRNVSRKHPAFAAAHPEVPWRSPYEMRNALVHGYFDVDFVWTWSTLQTDLLTFAAQIRALLLDLDQPPAGAPPSAS